jgi:trimeric autotransporter adhesin
MLRTHLVCAFALTLFASTLSAAPLVYQGELLDGGKPADGRYDLKLTPFADAKSGPALAEFVVMEGVRVEHGRFKFEVDFGERFAGNREAYVALAVRDSGGPGTFVEVAGRQKIAAAAATIGACWSTTGDAGSDPTVNFLGTTDVEPLLFKVNGLQAGRIGPSGDPASFPDAPNVVLGSSANTVGTGTSAVGATVGGGGGPSLATCGPTHNQPCINSATKAFATVGGGLGNLASGTEATVAGGLKNTASGFQATVGGGRENTASGFNKATVAGGENNLASGDDATVSGGSGNTASFINATVAGGASNTASNTDSTVGGGSVNTANGSAATVGGGSNNTANGLSATVPGGALNDAGGDYSFAAGQGAHVRDKTTVGNGSGDAGTFVWADSVAAQLISTGSNQFLIRSTGGFALNTTPRSAATEMTLMGADANVDLHLFPKDSTFGYGLAAKGTDQTDTHFFINQTNGTNVFTRRMEIVPTGLVGFGRTPTANNLEVEGTASKTTAGSWLANSDARIKQDIAPVAHPLDALAALKPVTFRYSDAYRAAHPSIADHRYYNVVAQDFALVFPDAVQSSREYLPGASRDVENEILQVDIHPALITTIAAAKELAERSDDQAGRLQQLEREIGDLRSTNTELRKANENQRTSLEQQQRALDALLTRMAGLESRAQ